MEKKIAYVFQECTELYHYCDDDLGYLDARGRGFKSVRELLCWLRMYRDENGYTHYKRFGKLRKL